MYILRISHDEDCNSPMDWDGQWKLYSFSTNHRMFRHPNEFANIGMRRKLAVGLAFVLSYYQHSGSMWSLQGEGPQCRFDTVQAAGMLVWEHKPGEMGAKTYEDRRKDAQCFLDTWNDWANGACYHYSLEKVGDDDEGEEVDSCGGFIGAEHLEKYVLLQLKALEIDPKDVQVRGVLEGVLTL